MPNNCGLPTELVDFDLSQSSSAKKIKRETVIEEGGGEEGGRGGERVSGEEREEDVRTHRSARKSDETIKMGKVYVPKYVFMHTAIHVHVLPMSSGALHVNCL